MKRFPLKKKKEKKRKRKKLREKKNIRLVTYDIRQLKSHIRRIMTFTVDSANPISRFQITSVIHTLLFIRERTVTKDYISSMLVHTRGSINRSRFSEYRGCWLNSRRELRKPGGWR